MPSVRDIRQLFERWAYPELARIAPHHRERALARARNEPLEFLEIGGILTALFVVTVSTRYGLKDPMLADRLARLQSVRRGLGELPLRPPHHDDVAPPPVSLEPAGAA